MKKSVSILDFFQVGCYIDAQDSVNNWCVGQVIEVSKQTQSIKVKFDGWSSKWNEPYLFTSHRIAPFRKYSKGRIIFFHLNKLLIRFIL